MGGGEKKDYMTPDHAWDYLVGQSYVSSFRSVIWGKVKKPSVNLASGEETNALAETTNLDHHGTII
jgi:hypothetical protein